MLKKIVFFACVFSFFAQSILSQIEIKKFEQGMTLPEVIQLEDSWLVKKTINPDIIAIMKEKTILVYNAALILLFKNNKVIGKMFSIVEEHPTKDKYALEFLAISVNLKLEHGSGNDLTKYPPDYIKESKPASELLEDVVQKNIRLVRYWSTDNEEIFQIVEKGNNKRWVIHDVIYCSPEIDPETILKLIL